MEHQEILIKRVRRRQHSSCDQCRKAKRACDAVLQGEQTHPNIAPTPAPTARHTAHHGKHRLPAAKCSNCQKAGRSCTFEWLECALPKAGKGIKKKPQPRHDIDAAKQKSTTHFLPQKPTYASTLGSDPDIFSDLGPQNLDFDSIDDADLFDFWASPDTSFDPALPLAQLNGFPATYMVDNQTPSWDDPLPGINNPPSLLQARSWTGEETIPTSVEDIPDRDQVMTFEEEQYQERSQKSDSSETWFQGTENMLPCATSRCSSDPIGSQNHFPSTLLSTSTLSSGTNRWLLAQNWLRVYHDSFENALSCWLTERNCPYTLARNGTAGLDSVWGSKWSNRIYKRVCDLDKFVNNFPGKALSRAENSIAGKALNAAVMAFGVQWAQAGDRGNVRDHISFVATQSVHEEMNLPAADGFGRSVQETLWNQARQALQDAAGIQSYRVAFANIIFSLTQRPLNFQDWARSASWKSRSTSRSDTGSGQTGLSSHFDLGAPGIGGREPDSRWEALQEIIDADGPPVFLDAALRQLISSRWRWEQYNRQRAKTTTQSVYGSRCESRRSPFAAVLPTREHRETFQLLSWLAIMFDTLSAAILRRPPVVPDEDTNIEASDPWETIADPPLDSPNDVYLAPSTREVDLDGWDVESVHFKAQKPLRSSDIWENLFLGGQDVKTPNEKQPSPYNLEDAASILCDAAPVKVLLFRKVGHIQKLMSRRAGSEALEQAVDNALRVYALWNKSYGKFIAKCMTRHHDLPARIQSWYLVLAGHWHLGAMLLADVVQEMDDAGLGLPVQRGTRRMSRFSDDMRRKNAIAISELCRCSLHGSTLSFSTAHEFTYPVNQVALLSEPWTMVLIQSFSRAGYVFVSQLNTPQRWRNAGWSTVEDERGLAKRRCGYCIEGLLNLGNKSDMAYLAGKFLKDCLSDLDE